MSGSLTAAAAAAAADAEHRPSRIPNPSRALGPLPGPPPVPGGAGMGRGGHLAFIVDREKTCPLLLRVFPKHGGHHSLEEYAVRGQEPKSEVQIYTWKDATLGELTDLIKEVNAAARRRDARLSFAFIYPNRQGRNIMKQVGITYANSRQSFDDNKTLHDLGFQTGDFLDVAIFS